MFLVQMTTAVLLLLPPHVHACGELLVPAPRRPRRTCKNRRIALKRSINHRTLKALAAFHYAFMRFLPPPLPLHRILSWRKKDVKYVSEQVSQTESRRGGHVGKNGEEKARILKRGCKGEVMASLRCN